MNPKSIRIGNLLLYNGFIVEVVEVKRQHFRVSFPNGENKNEMMSEHDNFKGIEITEEWLLKLGFEKLKNNFYSKGRLTYHKKYGWKILENWVKDWVGVTAINHVHQLQNIYSALTGEELTCASQQINKSTNQ